MGLRLLSKLSGEDLFPEDVFEGHETSIGEEYQWTSPVRGAALDKPWVSRPLARCSWIGREGCRRIVDAFGFERHWVSLSTHLAFDCGAPPVSLAQTVRRQNLDPLSSFRRITGGPRGGRRGGNLRPLPIILQVTGKTKAK